MNSIEELRKLGNMKKYREDEVLFYQGETEKCAYLILKGKVSVSMSSAFDGSDMILAVIGEGDIVGEMAILDKSPRSATVKALEDVIALQLEEKSFLSFIKMNPKYGKGLLKSLSQRIKHTKGQIDLRAGDVADES